ncbi:MAG: tripartite tricarboxylate transporter substrate binding protein [Betaproteobacteria bacterium]|nr:tripartite tricarboxylate transporter substrate binding protein [Betaproteobacteria bacterium]MDH4324342.1 tripartite tricarboxylate transporter substrate binding protein [Betaproteobacteria bacterium]
MKPLATLLLALVPCLAQAQSYPTRPITIIVPFGAGGPADIYARFLGGRMQEALGQFVVENRPGGGSVVGSNVVAQAAPDGHTLLLMSNTHTVNETLIPNKPFQLMRDFVPVAPINYSDLLLVVHPSVQASDLKSLIALAKREPGKMNYASSGPGTPYHMAGELFKSLAGIDVVHIPHKGSDQARLSILSGQVQMMFDAITTMAPQAQAGKVKALATSGRARSSVMSDVPTVAEAGVPGYEATIWLGVVAPKGTPRAIVERLNAEITKVTTSADVKAAWAKQGANPLVMSPAEFEQYLHADIAKWAKVIAQAGIKRD